MNRRTGRRCGRVLGVPFSLAETSKGPHAKDPAPAPVVGDGRACLALLVALDGTSVATVTQLARNSVGTPQLRNSAVTTGKIRTKAVTAPKVRNNSITSAHVRNRSLTRADFAPGPQDPQA